MSQQITMDQMWEQEYKAGRTKLSRRSFAKLAGITAAGFAALKAQGINLAQANSLDLENGYADGFEDQDEAFWDSCEKYYASCSPECQHHNLCAYVKDGKVLRVGIGLNNESAPCLRGFARIDWLNSDERLTKPLVRDGEKGEGKFKEIGWDEALDLLANKLQEAIDEGGNQSIVFDGHAGNFHSLPGQAASAFIARMGGTMSLTGTLCCAGMNGGFTPIWGQRFNDTRNTIAESDYVLIWGNNPFVAMGGYWERFEACKANGGKLTVIDPVKSESAELSDEWVAIRPSTDGAMALGMLKVIIEEGLQNTEFLLAHTTAPVLIDAEGAKVLLDPEDELSYAVIDSATGELARHDAEGVTALLSAAGTQFEQDYTTVYDLIVAQTQPWTPEAVEAECGVPAETVVRLAREYAAAGKAMIIMNMGGFMRVYYGSDAVANIANLSLFCGQLGARGNGVYDAGGITNICAAKPIFQNPKPLEGLPTVPRVQFAHHVLADDPNPVKVFVSYRESPMTQWPNSGLLKEALKKIPFVCVMDQFMTSTALYADLILPGAAVFETEDLLWSSRSHLIQLSEKAIEAPGEAKDDLWVFGQLAQKMGLGDDMLITNEEAIRRATDSTDYPYDLLKEEKSIDAMPPEFVPYEGGIFKTKSQKAELYQPNWLALDHPGVPTYIKGPEAPGGASGLDTKYPLQAVQRKLMTEVHSTFANLPTMIAAGSGVAHCLINVADADARGIADGDAVKVFNDRGEHSAVAVVTTGIMPGVVGLDNGVWEQHGGSSSYVTNDASGFIAGEHCCNETLVEVALA